MVRIATSPEYPFHIRMAALRRLENALQKQRGEEDSPERETLLATADETRPMLYIRYPNAAKEGGEGEKLFGVFIALAGERGW